jgi:uncharacterized damage-inducible protein DinB
MPLETPSAISRFRLYYDHERDANAKIVQMLESVPVASRAGPLFARALGKAAHLAAARHMWLHRLGLCHDKPESWFPDTTLEELPAAFARVEAMWTDYLASLTEPQVLADVQWVGQDGKRRRYPLIDLLTQVNGHAWYHRGQIAMLVKDLGGQPVDSDYIFWNKPTVLGDAG